MGKINCFQCARKCKGDVLKVGEKYFHKECFTCKVCHKKLDDTGFFSKEDGFYCPDDYKTYCAAVCFSCREKIIGEVVSALNHTFHKDCFKCSSCQKNFTPGDRVSMKNVDFLCNDCSKQFTNRDNIDSKIEPIRTIHNESTKQSVNGRTSNNPSKLESTNQIKDSDSFSAPIRRKIVTNKSSINYQPMTLSLSRPNSSHSSRIRPVSSEDNNLEVDNSYANSNTTPKHFHIPQGNNRYWMYNSTVVGTKNHPLALSATNINRLSSSSQKVNGDSFINKENVKKLSRYPSGYVSDKQDIPLERDDWPSPPAAPVMTEKNRRKIPNPTVEALSAGTTPKIRKAWSGSQGGDINVNSPPSRIGISEMIKRSTTDCSSFDHLHKTEIDAMEVPKDPISASRSPSAICEPLVPPRYDIHMETSPSRNGDFFKQAERHLGYSMDFVNSTNRSFSSDNTVPKYRKALRNSYVELRQVNSNQNGSINPRVNSATLSKDFKSTNNRNKHHSANLSRESDSFIVSAIPYSQLRISNRRIIKHLDRSRLETYISDDEFHKLFNLTRQAFYQLPEWKRNDLKKQVDLF